MDKARRGMFFLFFVWCVMANVGHKAAAGAGETTRVTK